MIIGIKSAEKLLKRSLHDISTKEMIKALKELAKMKHPGKKIKPCPRRSWADCYEHYPEIKMYYLCFHVNDNKSSDGITIQY